jgi:HEPN domain-containing protein
MAREYFEEWFPSGAGRLDTARYVETQGRLKEAAFDLHQAAERLYHCVLLVCTFYTPHVHNLAFLRTQAERLDRRLVHVWPMDSRGDRAMFEKLKDAYVKARYSKHYRVTHDELAWLGSRVEDLGGVVQVICSERIAQLEAQARAA